MTIRVGLVTQNDAGFIEHGYTPHEIDDTHTVLQAVQQVYPAFPGACQSLYLKHEAWRRLPAECIWDPATGFAANADSRVLRGDTLDVMVEYVIPGGPQAQAIGGRAATFVPPHQPVPQPAPGAQGTRHMRALLAEMGGLSAQAHTLSEQREV